jgi:Asp-tRNAAsn/Glu-tRNAGln amidotransferase A subunit and related amidases
MKNLNTSTRLSLLSVFLLVLLWNVALLLPVAEASSSKKSKRSKKASKSSKKTKNDSAKDLLIAELEAKIDELESQVSNIKTLGQVYMEDMILVDDYDGSANSFHFRNTSSWANRVQAGRNFRATSSGSIYNYRNKVLMGMAQSRILNEAPEVTDKDAVEFDIPLDIVRPETDEEVMMLSVLEMQGLLRTGQLSSVELTTIALDMLEKYDPEFNMVEVELYDLALRVAGEADALFESGTFVSPIQGIPFAIKDTYDVSGYATAYGSWEFM